MNESRGRSNERGKLHGSAEDKADRSKRRSLLGKIADDQKRRDCQKLLAVMRKITKAGPKLWGSSIIGFGVFRCRSARGRECDWFQTGFAPRQQNLSIYIMSGCERHKDLLEKLGKHRVGMCCLYIKRLADVHVPTLEKLIRESVKHTRLVNL